MDPTPIMFLGITEGAWKWLLGAVPFIIGWGWWLALKVRAMATRAGMDKLQGSIDKQSRIQGKMLTLQEIQLDEQGVKFTAGGEVKGKGGSAG